MFLQVAFVPQHRVISRLCYFRMHAISSTSSVSPCSLLQGLAISRARFVDDMMDLCSHRITAIRCLMRTTGCRNASSMGTSFSVVESCSKVESGLCLRCRSSCCQSALDSERGKGYSFSCGLLFRMHDRSCSSSAWIQDDSSRLMLPSERIWNSLHVGI